MTKNDSIIRDTYELVDRRTAEIVMKFDKLEDRVGVLETWRANFIGKMTIIVSVLAFGLTLFTDWVRKQLRIV